MTGLVVGAELPTKLDKHEGRWEVQNWTNMRGLVVGANGPLMVKISEICYSYPKICPPARNLVFDRKSGF
jgi:hypothetical protein